MEETLNEKANLPVKKDICVGFLSPRWHQDYYGIATLTHLLIDNIRTVDEKSEVVKIYCLVAQRKEDISQEDYDDAAKRGVMLVGAESLFGDLYTWNTTLERAIDALNVFPGAYYHHIQGEIPKLTHLVGHIPYLADGPLNIKTTIYKDSSPKIILMNHVSATAQKAKGDEVDLLRWYKSADYIFSVGHILYDDTDKVLKALDIYAHSLYLPGCSTDYLKTKWTPAQEGNFGHHVLVLASDIEMQKMTGKDIPLAVRIMAKVNELSVLANSRNRITLKIGNVPTEEWQIMEGDIEALIKYINMKNSHLSITNTIVDTPEKLTRLLKSCALYLLPLKQGALIFDIETLKAASIGLPILVPKTSSAACLIQNICTLPADEFMVGDHSNFEKWVHPVMDKLGNQKDALRVAEDIRHSLILDTTIAKTNMGFVKEILNCAEVRLKLSTATKKIPDEGKKLAAEYSITNMGEISDENAVAFSAQFLSTILHRREKMTLEEIKKLMKLDETFEKVWDHVFTTLEGNGRKLLDINFQGDDLVLDVHYSTQESFQKLCEKVQELHSDKQGGWDYLSQTLVKENVKDAKISVERRRFPEKQVKATAKQNMGFITPGLSAPKSTSSPAINVHQKHDTSKEVDNPKINVHQGESDTDKQRPTEEESEIKGEDAQVPGSLTESDDESTGDFADQRWAWFRKK